MLPDFRDKWVVVKEKQAVDHIIKDLLDCHYKFAGHYDNISQVFKGQTVADTCDRLYYFCKENIRYKEEGESEQTTAIPAGILVRGQGDCKHYASFIAGCLCSLARSGYPVSVSFCFASYKEDQRTPYHVFVICNDLQTGDEIWIDPTPGSANMVPVWVVEQNIF